MAITQSNGSTDVTEGGATDTYTVVLDSEPTDDVTITIGPDGQNELGSGSGAVIQLTFTPGNFSTAQTRNTTAWRWAT